MHWQFFYRCRFKKWRSCSPKRIFKTWTKNRSWSVPKALKAMILRHLMYQWPARKPSIRLAPCTTIPYRLKYVIRSKIEFQVSSSQPPTPRATPSPSPPLVPLPTITTIITFDATILVIAVNTICSAEHCAVVGRKDLWQGHAYNDTPSRAPCIPHPQPRRLAPRGENSCSWVPTTPTPLIMSTRLDTNNGTWKSTVTLM